MTFAKDRAMGKKPDIENAHSEPESEETASRREFLRKSLYTAYATPLITALLVEQANADASNACDRTDRPPWCR